MNKKLQIISTKLAKLLKLLKFNYPTYQVYNKYGNLTSSSLSMPTIFDDFDKLSLPKCSEDFPAPTMELAKQWMRDIKNVHIVIIPTNCHLFPNTIDNYTYTICGDIIDEPECSYRTYEEALEAGLLKACEYLIKNQHEQIN